MDNNKNNKTDWSKRDVGALWKRESATQKYLSGYVKVDELGIERELKIVVFSNKNKKDNLKAPDYRIYLSVPKADSVNKDQAPQLETEPSSIEKISKKSKKTQELESEVSVSTDGEDIL